jgi:hypothetical protein
LRSGIRGSSFADNEDDDEKDVKMVNLRQPKIDALLAAIGIGDETVITSSCKGLQLADFYLIVTQVCLKPKPVVNLEEGEDNDTDENATTDANATLKLKEAEEIEAQEVAKKKVAEDHKEAEKRKAKIKCRYFLKFGSSVKNDKGCKNGSKCPYFHPRLCRLALKGQCKDSKCGSHHLTATKPPAKVTKTTTSSHSSGNNNSGNNNNNNKSRPTPNSSHHQTTKGPFLGQTGLNHPGSMEELAKIVTQMVLLSLNNMQQRQVPQMSPQMWGGGARWGL